MLMLLPPFVDEYYEGFSEYIFLSCYVPAGRPYSRHPGVFATIFDGAIAL